MRFENPEMVSIGSQQDMLVGTIIDESFFCQGTATIKSGTTLETILPRLFSNTDLVEVLD